MLNIFTFLLDVLFPPRDGELLVRRITDVTLASLYIPSRHLNIEYISHFQSPTIRALITENKYYANMRATTLLAALLAMHIKRKERSVCIAIPLHPKRERERGYNQVTVVLERSGCVIGRNLITRSTFASSQTKLQKRERLENIKGAFTVNETRLREYKNTHFILVDDVVTTGATMTAARAALAAHLDHTCTLTCLALAH